MTAAQPPLALAPAARRVQLDSRRESRSVRSTQKHWQLPESLSANDVKAAINAATRERNRLLLRVLWATGARISEGLALPPQVACQCLRPVGDEEAPQLMQDVPE
jgi:site-specific recombinase XerD